MRLKDRIAIVCGAGQTPGATIGNGRATAITFAREGATVVAVDRQLESAEQTAAMITEAGGQASAVQTDITDEDAVRKLVARCVGEHGRIDILHNNVGIGAGDQNVVRLEAEAWDRIFEVNLKSMFLTCKHVLPVMKDQGGGVIINISSVAAIARTALAAYKTSKAGVNALTQQIAAANARFGIRANVISPGLMDTPMAVEGNSAVRGVPRDVVARERDALVPLGRKMGTAWDVANAALFLASDEADFITGVNLPVDGGQSTLVG